MIAVTIELRELRERHLADPGRVDVNPGDRILLSTDNGLEVGRVIESENIINRKVEMKIIRHLNENDLRVIRENIQEANKVRPVIQNEIEKERLKLRLTHVLYTYDRQKLFIYYTADSRVDFRNLIRTLGGRFKTRIQMVQIGVRDEASIMGGVGRCGRVICCYGFLRDIESVNIDMARTQHLSVNTESITGCCGRLFCCLRFENNFYEEIQKDFPKMGKKVNTSCGKGDVVDLNYLQGTVSVKLKTGIINKFPISELRTGVKEKLKKWIK